ncbi:MAG: hypothetical protein GX612_03290 [Bacteroidales bacterium]|mgnify:CR=1 FL=1|nr:hypothetical protein [Bacteroidales bacterium]
MKPPLKKSIKYISLFAIFISLKINVNGQMFPDTLIYGDTIYLADSAILNSNSKIIVFYDNEKYSIFSSQNLLLINLKKWIKKYDIDWDKDLLKLLENENKDIIYLDSLDYTLKQKSRLVYRWADLMENKKCLIYNKETKILEKKIRIEHFLERNYEGKNYKLLNEDLILKLYTGVY